MLYGLPNHEDIPCPTCGRVTRWMSARDPLHLHRIFALEEDDIRYVSGWAEPLPWYLRPLATNASK